MLGPELTDYAYLLIVLNIVRVITKIGVICGLGFYARATD